MVSSALLPLAALTTLGKVVLSLVAATFIIWSLVTALSIPKRYPNFPENLGMFLTITAVLFVAQMAAVVWVTGTQEVEKEKTAHEAGAGKEKPKEPAAVEGDAAAGKSIFSASCAGCHTLADAGATGSVGPNLDSTKSPLDVVVDRVTNGKGAMPSFKGQLDEQQIADVSAYVVSATG
ncbi:MAG: cytochrome c [Actinobacteria bacterium]|nr:cytochrome c [Actinomycetota bacterium]